MTTSPRTSRRLPAVLVLMVLLLTACGSQAPEETASEPQGSSTPGASAASGQDGTPQSGGTLVVGMENEFPVLDPNASQSRYEHQVFMNVFDTLISRSSEDQEFRPGLAESWEISDDGLAITFHLREGVTFHDGTPFNAEAVAFNFDRIVDPETQSKLAVDLLGPYEETEVVDDYTAIVHFSDPLASALDAFSQGWLSIVSPAAVEEFGEDFFRNPVGTGPFKFEEFVDDNHVVLTRNDDYDWAPGTAEHNGPAYLERLEFRLMEEPTVRVAAMESGETGLTQSTPAEAIDRLTESGYQLLSGSVPGMPVLYHLNVDKSPTDDLLVRQAINHAVDKQAAMDAVFFGHFPPAAGPLSPTTWGYWSGAEEMYPYDPERAGELLDEAGWTMNEDTGIREKDGELLIIDHISLRDPELATEVQAQMQAIGIDWRVRLPSLIEEEEDMRAGDYNAIWNRYTYGDPDMMRIAFHSENIPSPDVFGWAESRYVSEELDALLEQGASTYDEAERRQIYEEAQRLVMEEALVLPLYVVTRVTAFPETLHGVGLEGHFDYFTVYDAWLDQ